MPTPINLESSGLSCSSRTEVLARRGLVYSNTTLMDQDEGMTKPQNAHLRSASQQSFSSVHVPFSTICPFGGLPCWVQSLAVKVQASSTLTVSRHDFTLFAFEPVTSTKQISLPNTALNTTAEMQPSADISQDTGPLVEQPIAVTDSSQYNFPKVSRHAVALSAFKPVTSPNQNIFATIALKAIAEMQASADSNKTCNRFNITQPIFQSIDAFVTNFQLILIVDSFQLKQELIDFSSLNAFSIANLSTIFQKFSLTVAFTSGAQSARASPLTVFANQTNAMTKNLPKKQVHGFHCRKRIESRGSMGSSNLLSNFQ
jgi:hypothetical protein